MKKIGLLLATLSLMVFGAAAVVQPAYVNAVGKEDICAGLDAAGGTSSCNTPAGGATVESTVKTLVSIFSWVVGVISIVMVIVGGFQYVTSGGDSGKVTTAKNTIMYALIGIVIVALAQLMVNYVLAKVVD